ncbi:MAG: T9SS type A sorting domain-containing protein [Bacteroidetes bacterium]|nr:T9SS type A sorting domain-containing protein [Bacteroidota bacterium]
MKKLVLLLTLGFINLLFAQMNHNGGYLKSDSLETVSVSGTVILDETTVHPMYYLDEDNDGTAEYQLNFGPFWYAPDSSNAVRPEAGAIVSVSGGLMTGSMNNFQVVVVYEIDDEFWRDPYLADWNNMGRNSHNMSSHHGDMGGRYGFGWNHDSLSTVTLQGTAIIDTTMLMDHYYIDIDSDLVPDYMINFGSPWYISASGAERPSDGDAISILGGLLNSDFQTPMVIVYELNGEVWRDSSTFGEHFGGGWFHGNMTTAQQFHSPFDTSDNMTVYPGWRNNQGGMGSGMMSDSLFCQILEVYPENIPNSQSMNTFAGYEVHMFGSDGVSGMNGMNGMGGGRMNFGSNTHFQLHYDDMQLNQFGIVEDNIEAKYWDEQSTSWVALDVTLDKESNTVSFNSSVVSNYVVLSASSVTSVETVENVLPSEFQLAQNYPNPFNPSTVIQFNLNSNSHVRLNIYNILGEKITELVNEIRSAGVYSVTFNASSLPSGIYFYELQVGNKTNVKKMNLMK